jgi:hypothetical protein
MNFQNSPTESMNATELQLFSLLLNNATPAELNIKDRYTLLSSAIAKAQSTVIQMINNDGSVISKQSHDLLVSQEAQLHGMACALQGFSQSIDEGLQDLECESVTKANRAYLEKSFGARPAKTHAAPETPSRFKQMTRAERVRLMQG